MAYFLLKLVLRDLSAGCQRRWWDAVSWDLPPMHLTVAAAPFILTPVKHMIVRLFPLHYIIEESVNLIIPEYEE